MSQVFDPTYAAQHLVPASIDELSEVKPLAEHIDMSKLKLQTPSYLTAAKDIVIDRSAVETYTDSILRFWRATPSKHMSEWRKAANIVFAMTPNSASCERVFSLLNVMYGNAQDNTLADHIQASLMMRFNARRVG